MDNMKKLEELIAEYKPVEPGSLTPETTFAQLDLDSLDLVDMAMACEDRFGVTVEVNENLKTIGDLLKILDAAG